MPPGGSPDGSLVPPLCAIITICHAYATGRQAASSPPDDVIGWAFRDGAAMMFGGDLARHCFYDYDDSAPCVLRLFSASYGRRCFLFDSRAPPPLTTSPACLHTMISVSIAFTGCFGRRAAMSMSDVCRKPAIADAVGTDQHGGAGCVADD